MLCYRRILQLPFHHYSSRPDPFTVAEQECLTPVCQMLWKYKKMLRASLGLQVRVPSQRIHEINDVDHFQTFYSNHL